jgi:2-(1,2-epoxy-1,2-dihydrophenyl)acetyl-CoA isomerase
MSVALEVEGGVARLTLNRPDAGNALDPETAAALAARAAELEARDDVRAVVLSGAGKAFCVGGDLRFMAAAGDDAERAVRALATDFHAALESLTRLDAPVITVVNGVAAGGGMSMAIAGDLVLAAESARFTMAYTAAGLAPDGGSTWLLPRLVGVRRASELMLLNERLSAAQALELGLVTRVVPDAELAAVAGELATRLAAGATRAYGEVKRLLRTSATTSFSDQLVEEATTIGRCAGSPHGREGIAAFLEKRAPQFS